MKANPIIIGSFYQDQKAGERMIKNLSEFGIPSIWSNGRVEGFTKINNSDVSTDNLKEIILSYPNTKVYDIGLTYPGYATNYLMQLAADMGYTHTFLLSCDEYLEGDWNLFKTNLEKIPSDKPSKMRLPIVEHNPTHNKNVLHITERVVYMPQYVFIQKIHWLYYHNYYRNPEILSDTKSKLVLGLTVHHDDSIRLLKRNKMMDKYQKQRRVIEVKELIQVLADEHLLRTFKSSKQILSYNV